MNNLQAQYVKEYGPGNYIPNVFIQYWGMRVMAYLAALIALFALWGLWLIRRKTLEQGQVVPPDRPVVRHHAVPHEHGRVAADRERPTTLDRPGPDEDVPGCLALGDRRPTSGSA